MNKEQKRLLYEKYIKKIIMPRFDDILEFEINYRPSLGKPVYDIHFIMDGTEDEIESDIENDIFEMKTLFDDDVLFWVTFETY